MALEGKGSITNNGLFVYPRDADLTKADLKSMLDYHSTEMVAKYTKAASITLAFTQSWKNSVLPI